jgi:hypothetical protein
MGFELQAFLQPVDFTQNVLRTFEQALAGRRQPDAALDPIEQQKTQFLLQMLDLPRQRRLRDPQIVAGFAEILPPRGLNKIAELAQIHVAGLFFMMPILDQSDDNSILS